MMPDGLICTLLFIDLVVDVDVDVTVDVDVDAKGFQDCH